MKERKIVLYPKVVVKAQDFKKSTVHTVPNQSMSLREILTRFTRREPLPVEKEGYYETRFGDIEKLKNLDPVEQQEESEKLKDLVKKGGARIKKEQQDAEEKRKAEEIEVEVQKRVKAQQDATPQDPPKPTK